MPEDYSLLSEEIQETLEDYARLEPYWDGHEASAISQKAIDKARKFLFSFTGDTVKPYTGPCPDGAVDVYFENAGLYLVVSFDDSDTYSYSFSNDNLCTFALGLNLYFSEVITLVDTADDDLLKLLELFGVRHLS